jgi:hypothetical protein
MEDETHNDADQFLSNRDWFGNPSFLCPNPSAHFFGFIFLHLLARTLSVVCEWDAEAFGIAFPRTLAIID